MANIKPGTILSDSVKHSLSKHSWYQLIEDAYPISKEQYQRLWNLHPQQRDEIMMFGRLVRIPRYQKLYGNKVEYRYSGKNLISETINNEVMATSLNWVNAIDDQNYNGMLVNWYQDGTHYMGAHSDDERDLSPQAAIYSFSFGATRTFRIINKATSEKTDLLLRHGSLLVMGGSMQHEFKHALPATKKCKASRVNFTIRSFLTIHRV